jgi:hypothetical protein
VFERGKAGNVAAGTRHVADEPGTDGIGDLGEDHRNRRGFPLQRGDHLRALCDDDIRLERHHVRRVAAHEVGLAACIAIGCCDVAALNPTQFAKSPLERRKIEHGRSVALAITHDNADAPHPLGLLRPRRDRPRRRPADDGDELPTPQVRHESPYCAQFATRAWGVLTVG